MLYQMFSIHDVKVGAFQRPFFARNVSEACRMFERLVGDPQSDCYAFPEDFTLHHVGSFDDSTAYFDLHKPVPCISRGLDFKRPDPTSISQA